MERYAVGVDIGGTNTDLGLVDAGGHIVCRASLPTGRYAEFAPYVADLVALALKLKAECEQKMQCEVELAGFGIGAPNANFNTCCVVDAVNLPFKGVLDFGKEIGKHLAVPVALDNDANAAASGELIYGGAKGMRHVIVFTLGTGVGSGIVVDGRVVRGATGAAGELGHVTLVPGGRACSCGHCGCLEAYASARGIVRTYLDLRRDEGPGGGILAAVPDEEVSCQAVGDAARQGDPLAMKAWAMTGEWLGQAMANAVAFSSPEAIFLTGGPSRVGEPLMAPLREAFERHLLFFYRGTCAIHLSSLPSNEAAILGAASLVMHEA